MSASNGQYAPGSATNPRAAANGETGSHNPVAMTVTVVAIRGQLAQLCRNGIWFVRMMWMISVCVSSDSTNQPVWNSARCAGVPAVEDVEHQKKVV